MCTCTNARTYLVSVVAYSRLYTLMAGVKMADQPVASKNLTLHFSAFHSYSACFKHCLNQGAQANGI